MWQAITTKNPPTNIHTTKRKTNERTNEETKISERMHIYGKGGKMCVTVLGSPPQCVCLCVYVCLSQEKISCSKIISPNFEHRYSSYEVCECARVFAFWMLCICGRTWMKLCCVCLVLPIFAVLSVYLILNTHTHDICYIYICVCVYQEEKI